MNTIHEPAPAAPRRNERGFTIIEVMVAIMILTSGLFALASASAFLTRTIGGAKYRTTAAEVARWRMESLRLKAMRNPAALCTDPTFISSAGTVTTQGVQERWEVPATGLIRTVRVITTARLAGRVKVDTLASRISCY